LPVIPLPVLPRSWLSRAKVRSPSLKPGTAVEFVAEGTKVLLRPAKDSRNPVDTWLKHATGAAKGKATTAQIMKLTRGED